MFAILYNATLLSMLICAVLFKNTWLEMRVNLGFVFFALIIAIFILFFILQRIIPALNKIFKGLKFTTLNLALVLFICWILTGSDGFFIIPAAIVREGLMSPKISLSAVNYALSFIIVFGWIILALKNLKFKN